jgi:hypothetical protein
METCSICKKEFKNKNGLRLHSRIHQKDESLIEEYNNVTGTTIQEQEETYNEENLPLARIKLYKPETNDLIISYPVQGKEEIEKAKENAERKGYRIEIS